MSQTLRPYQEDALAGIRKHYAQGIKRVLLQLATGGGKTKIFCEVLKSAHQKGRKALMVVRGKDLVDQASKRLFAEGVPHGCLQGDHWNNRPDERVQVCSIDTLYRRGLTPPADLIIIDEAHYATSPSFMWLIEKYPNAYFLPVTATPYVKKGLRHVADEIVYPVTIKQLMDMGYLAVPTYYAPTHLNLSGVSIDASTSDYNTAQTANVMNKSSVYGDVIAHYKRICPNEPAVLFAINIDHSKLMVNRFRAAGIEAVHVEANTPREEREQAIERLRTGEIKVICNVGILTTGVDIPFLRAVILARPTKSYNLFIQICGRGTRVTPTKKEFFILDHANNLDEHGFIEAERLCDLDGEGKKNHSVKPFTCEQCYAVYVRPVGKNVCPGCGHEHVRLVEEAPLKDIGSKEDLSANLNMLKYDADREEKSRMNMLHSLIEKAIRRKYKPGWVFHQLKGRYGAEFPKKHWAEIKKSVPGDDQTQRVAG